MKPRKVPKKYRTKHLTPVDDTCIACNGSGRYDTYNSPRCGACNGTGKKRGRFQMIECATAEQFMYFISLIPEIVEMINSQLYFIHSDTGIVIWEYIPEEDAFCRVTHSEI